jgi:hypothetical protein
VQYGSVVARIVAVVEVVLITAAAKGQAVGQRPRPVIPAVPVARLDHPKNEPSQHCENMHRVDLAEQCVA